MAPVSVSGTTSTPSRPCASAVEVVGVQLDRETGPRAAGPPPRARRGRRPHLAGEPSPEVGDEVGEDLVRRDHHDLVGTESASLSGGSSVPTTTRTSIPPCCRELVSRQRRASGLPAHKIPCRALDKIPCDKYPCYWSSCDRESCDKGPCIMKWKEVGRECIPW